MFKNGEKQLNAMIGFIIHVDPHGIYKFHEVGHQEHAWFIRTRPECSKIFQTTVENR